MPGSDLGKHWGPFYTLANRPAVVKVETPAGKPAIEDARRWSIHWQAD